MHELAVAQGIVDQVEARAAGRRVLKVTVEIGALTCVSKDALEFSFELVAESTAAHGAELEIFAVPGDALNIRSMEVEALG
ncbi:MAG: hydrogenase maturation nickel metallochaperone HypA [Pseudomonadota bacterium]|nr:hydrogenase maturation nickel metallochaperone HypA [Pseudomonadota bacterium]